MAKPQKRLLLIANPISGGGKGRRLAPTLAERLTALGVTCELHFTTRAGDAAERARRAGHEAWDGLIAIGGDGTVNEVLNGMPDPSRPLGMLPLGTANVLAAEYALPHDVDGAAAVFARGTVRELSIASCQERRFLLFAGAGLDGAIVHRVAARRSGTLGKHKYLVPILQILWRWQLPRLRVTLADGEVLEDLSTLLVSCVRNYGGMLRLPVETGATQPCLHVLAFRDRSRLAFLRHGWRGLWGRMRADRGLVVRRTTNVRVEGAAAMQIDGDPADFTPATIELLPTRARLFVP
jgi:diacylglycerol kinase (ATP)